MIPLIGAALGAVQLGAGLIGQNRQAKAQAATLQAQADSVKTQEHLTKLQVRQQQTLSESTTRLEQANLNTQRTLSLLELDNQEQQARIANTQQQMALDQRKFEQEQRATLAQSQALLQQTGELQQMEQFALQSAQQAQETILAQGANQVREANRGAAQVGTASDLTTLERLALGVGDSLQSSTQTTQQGISEAQEQLDYETQLALGLLDLDRVTSDSTQDQLDRSLQSDLLQLEGGVESIEGQFKRQNAALESAYATELAQLELASSSADVQSAAQQRALGAQSRAIQRPGVLGIIGGLGNAALGFYDAFQTQRTLSPPTQGVSSNPPSISRVPQGMPLPQAQQVRSAGLGLVPIR